MVVSGKVTYDLSLPARRNVTPYNQS